VLVHGGPAPSPLFLLPPTSLQGSHAAQAGVSTSIIAPVSGGNFENRAPSSKSRLQLPSARSISATNFGRPALNASQSFVCGAVNDDDAYSAPEKTSKGDSYS
jgi:hypothetical protein